MQILIYILVFSLSFRYDKNLFGSMRYLGGSIIMITITEAGLLIPQVSSGTHGENGCFLAVIRGRSAHSRKKKKKKLPPLARIWFK